MSCVPQGALLALLAAILQCAITSPVWMPQFLSGGSGRNIRHLPCVSRRTGETGVCMFAFTCMKANGTHLGTCIDRFYFGSCCRISEENVTSIPNTEDNNLFPIPTTTESKYHLSTFQSVQDNDNRVDVDDTPVKPIVIPSKKPSLPDKKPSTTTPTYSESPSTTNKPTTQTKPTKPTKTTTRKPITQTTTTRKPSTTKPTQTTTAKPTQTTTKKPVSQPKPTQTTTRKPVAQTKPTQTTTKKPVTQTKPTQTTTRKPVAQTKPTQTTTRKPATQTKPTQTTTRKPVTQTKPTQTTTRKPVAQTKPTQTTTKKPVTQTKPTQTTTKKPVTQTTTRKPVTQSKPTQTTPIKPVTLSRPSATTTRKPVTQTKPTQTTTKKPVIQTKPTQTTTKGPVTHTKPHFTTTRPTTEYFTETTTRKLDIFTDYADNTLSTQPSSLLTTLLHTTGKPVFQTSTWKPFTTTSTRRPVTWSTTWKPDLTTWTSSVIKPKPPASVTTKKPVTIATKKPPVKTTTTERPPETSTAPPASLVTWTLVQEPTKTEVTTASIDWILVPVTTHPPSGDTTQQAGTTTSSYPDTPTDASTAAITSTTSRPETTLAPEVTSSAAANISLDIDLNMTDFRQVCGRRLFPESRIVGGEKSSFGKWPWQISLRQWRTSTYLHKCGAALLNENWAITAAHCVENVPPSDLLLRLGEHDLSSEEEPYGYQERRVQIVASHPQFDPRTFEYDLALLRFYEPVTFQPNILPVCVPQDDTNFVGHTAYVTGWGRLYEDGPLPSVLQEVSVPVINNSVCETMYRSAGYIEHIPEIFICAGWRKGGFDSCEGDSGGPMVIQRPDKRWLLAGVISWGIGCAEPNQPGVYTRISEFREWINQILQF